MSKTGDGSWGHLADTEHFGRKCSRSDYNLIDIDTDLPKYKDFTHAGHCMIYAKQDQKIFGIYDPRAAVLMQMRFDGYLGFPGGLIDGEESVLTGLNRELEEELNFDVEKFRVKDENHVVSHSNEKEKLILHFYALEVPLKDFELIERNSLAASDYGNEVLGIVRAPLYTMGDGFRGFPAFLSNAFAGNSRQQLLESLVHLRLMSHAEVDRALAAAPR